MNTDTAAPRLLRITDVMERTNLSRSYIYALMKRGQFPKQISLGYKCSRWPANEVEDWLKAQRA